MAGCGAANATGASAAREAELSVLKVVTMCSASLSLCGSGFLVLTFHLTRTRRSLGFSIIYLLSVADLVTSLVYVIDGASPIRELEEGSCPDAFCLLKAVLSQLFGLAAIGWTAMIALNLQLTVVSHSAIVQHQGKLLLRMNLGVWGFSALSVLVTGIAGGFGIAGQWCWITIDALWARFIFYYLPMLLAMGYNMLVYCWTRNSLIWLHEAAMRTRSSVVVGMEAPISTRSSGIAVMRSRSSGTGVFRSSLLTELTSRMREFLLVFIVITTPQLINRLYDSLNPNAPSFVLALLHSLLGPLQGLGNAIIYGWTERVRRLYSSRWPLLCGWLAPASDSSACTNINSDRDVDIGSPKSPPGETEPKCDLPQEVLGALPDSEAASRPTV